MSYAKRKSQSKLSLNGFYVFIVAFGIFILGISVGYYGAINQVDLSFYSKKIVEVPEWNLPIQPLIYKKNGYLLAYDGKNRVPLWVWEKLSADQLHGGIRRHDQFREDPLIPAHIRATLRDYKGSGFDRGHMVPAADRKSNKEMMQETFYLSNMSPQVPALNRGLWAKLEKYTREQTRFFAAIHVITGPLYLPNSELQGKKVVQYQEIGPNDVAVPTHFFKVLLKIRENGQFEEEGYVMPNVPLHKQSSIEQFKYSVAEIGRLSGLIFNRNYQAD